MEDYLELFCKENKNDSAVFNFCDDEEWISLELEQQDGETHMVILDKDDCMKLHAFLGGILQKLGEDA